MPEARVIIFISNKLLAGRTGRTNAYPFRLFFSRASFAQVFPTHSLFPDDRDVHFALLQIYFALLREVSARLEKEKKNFSRARPPPEGGERSRRGCKFRRPPRLTSSVGIHARAFLRAVSSGMQMSAGCIRSITQRARETPWVFFFCEKRNTRRIRKRAEKSDASRVRCVRGSS